MGPTWGGGGGGWASFHSGDSSRMMFVHQETASLKVKDRRCPVLLWMQRTNTYGANLADGDRGDPVQFTGIQWFLGL